MHYLVLLVGYGDTKPWDQMSEQDQSTMTSQFAQFDEVCAAREGLTVLAGDELGTGDQVMVMSTRAGTVSLSRGPYAGDGHAVGGFYLIEAPQVEDVVEVLAVLPPFDWQISPVLQ